VDERREYQRLALTKPIEGWFGDLPIRLLDVSAKGAFIESEEDLPNGLKATLRFAWRGQKLKLKAVTVRNDEGVAGLHFLEDSEKLRRLIADSAMEVLRAQQANLEGQRERNIIAGEETLTTASAGLRAAGYVTWILEAEHWKHHKSLLPDQPDNGFTVAAGEPEENVATLRKTYEAGDDESRRLTRLLAELSVATVRRSP
jgi:hypothetical protein